jgi:hypothetical protein
MIRVLIISSVIFSADDTLPRGKSADGQLCGELGLSFCQRAPLFCDVPVSPPIATTSISERPMKRLKMTVEKSIASFLPSHNLL